MKARYKDPEGGLTEAGRRHYESTGESGNLQPGVKESSPTGQRARRKGSFLTRFYTNPSGPLVNDKGEPRTQWSANEAVVSVASNRSQIIEAIIGSVFSTGAKLAIINNQSADPVVYAAYQSFRAQAKQLADDWLNQ
jgi:hypothetical protein